MTGLLGVFKAIAATRAAHPGKFVLATEACNGFLPLDLGPKLGLWKRGELYAHDVLQDLAHGAAGWTDWNVVLNLRGGPNWAGNVVDAPILVNVTDAGGAHDPDAYFLQPMYFYLGHFARFLPPGAVRVGLVRHQATSEDARVARRRHHETCIFDGSHNFPGFPSFPGRGLNQTQS